jgi:hypothetical protein
LEGQCSKTFIKKSYKVNDIFCSNSKNQNTSYGSILKNNKTKTKGEKSRKSVITTEKRIKVDPVTEKKAKERHLDKKYQIEGAKALSTTNTGATSRMEGSTAYKTLSYNKNSEYFKRHRQSSERV